MYIALNAKSPGYAQVQYWISEIWQKFDKGLLIDSFNCCGITSRNKLHSAIDQILREKKVINDYVTDFSECSSYDSFEPESYPTIEDAEERLPNEIDNDESEDSDFEFDSSESESDGDGESSESDGESSEEENDSEAATSNKENEPIIDPKKAKKRANREAQYQRILSSSNPNNRPTYEIPATANNATSASKKPATKDVECDICHGKFTKQGLTRHQNSCKSKNKASNNKGKTAK
jgi:hypothetical protein